LKYQIDYHENVIKNDIRKLSKNIREKIRNAIEEKLQSNPIEFGKPLRYNLKGARRLRVQDWRVIYVIKPPSHVLVVKISHRREIYE